MNHDEPSEIEDDPKATLARLGISISVSVDPAPIESPEARTVDTGELCPTVDGKWLLNPKSTFPLVVSGLKEDALALKALLDESCSRSWYETLPKIAGHISRANLRCMQIDEYIEKNRPLYLETIESLKGSSAEWREASEKNREDLLIEFRQEALQHLNVRPNANLIALFEGSPADITVDDGLIRRFGYDAVIFYLRHAASPQKVRKIAADHYERPAWEKLVDLGLARRGSEIPISIVLEILTLKEMTDLVQDLNPPPFRRKAKAIEFLLAVPDIPRRLGERIAQRQLFQLKPLPDDFSALDLTEVQRSLAYSAEVGELLTHTSVMGYLAYQQQKRNLGLQESIEGWRILAVGGDSACPYCVEQSKRTFEVSAVPRVPLHLGCRCSLTPKIKGFDTH